ncbi:MAG: hypothetical protein LH702_10655 [Phormidesmis sp. CAN_BIN44]|nr:hypothetical protein [Phormidesmis sp. CAN_BIN44]
MKCHSSLSKVSPLLFSTAFLTVLSIAGSRSAFAQTVVVPQTQDARDVPLCFIETTKGQITSLELLCGKGGAGQNLRATALKSSSQIPVNLEWSRNNPSAPVSKAPSPYNAQGIRDFEKILYGD